MKKKDISEKQARAATMATNKLMRAFEKMDLEPEFAGYLLISSGLSLVTLNNPEEPLSVLHTLSKAIESSNRNVYDTIVGDDSEFEEFEEFEDYDDDEGVRH